MSVTLERHAALEAVTVQPEGAHDDQGAPSYGSPVTVQGRVVREDTVVRLPNGTEVRSVATIWIAGDQTALPEFEDRVEVVGLIGIVVERRDGKRLDGTLDHVRIKIREE